MKLKKPVLYHQQQYALSMILYDQYLHCKILMTTTVTKEMQFAFLVYTCTCSVVLHHVTINNETNETNGVVPENIHTYPKDGHWKIQGGGGLKSQTF